MKKILLFTLALISALVLISCAQTKDPVSHESDMMPKQSIEFVCEDGKIIVKGVFDNTASDAQKYTVNCAVVRNNAEKPLNISKSFDLVQGENSFEIKLNIGAKEQNVSVSVTADDGTELCSPFEKSFKSLRLLSIGNSFSVDAQEHLYGIAKDMGFDNVVLGNLYVGGCSLQGHYNYFVNERNPYTYYKNTTGEWTEKAETSMLEGIVDEDWDYITLQQASPSSGQSETYEPYLTKLVNYIKLNKTNPKAEIVWHMTWAYAADSTYEHFANYDYDQIKMYEAIVNAVEENAVNHPDVSFVIPSGTAIQNARNTSLGDTLCRDGFHLELGYGRYLAGLTWIHKITGQPIDDVTYIPDGAFNEDTLEILKKCAKDAVNNPFEVTVDV